MARRPAVARFDIAPEDPIDNAILTDREAIAEQLTEILDGLREEDQGKVRGNLYLIERGTNKYQWIREAFPPFVMSDIMTELKGETGGGDFQLRITVAGRRGIVGNINFSIMKDRPGTALAVQKGEGDQMMMMMMNMQMEAARESRASADRQMTMMVNMMQNSTQQMVGMMTALAGNGSKAADFLPIIAAMKTDVPAGNTMKDTLDMLGAAKNLIAPGDGGSGGFDPEDMVGSVLKLAGPVAGAVGRAINERRERMAANPAPVEVAGEVREAAPLVLNGPGISNHGPAPNGGLIEGPAPAPSRFPILDVIKPDVLYFFTRRHDPEKAADAILDVIERIEGSEGAIDELVATFALSADWKEDLAAEGIDLRSDAKWADEFLAALVELHASGGGDDDDSERGDGRETDASHDGEARPNGVDASAGSEPGGEAHD